MTDGVFWLRILLSFTIAGSWISLVSLLAGKLGSRLGGLLANLPSNIIVTMLFISINRGNDFAGETAASIPLGMTIDMIFLFVFMLASAKGPFLAILLSLFVWAICAIAAMFLPSLGLWSGILLFSIVSIVLFLFSEFVLKIQSVSKKNSTSGFLDFLIRALVSGSVVSGAVAAANFAPAYLAGIIATFPAVLLSTMTILTISQGALFARATGKVLLLSSSNIIVYALVVHILFPIIGHWLGSLLAFLAATLWVMSLRILLKKIS